MAPVDLNKNKKCIVDSHKEVFDQNSNTNWALYGYEGQTDVLNLIEKGDGGLEEFIGELNSGRIMYGYLKIIDPNSALPKFVFVNWQGEGVPELRKGACASHLRDITNLLRGAHVTINARREEDLDEKDVMAKVAKSSGANYGFHKEVPQKEIPAAGPIGSVYEKVKPQIEIKPQLREKFWEDTAKEQKQWEAEDAKRKQMEKEKLDKEIKERELKAAKERDARENERFKGIKEMKAAERSADSNQQQAEWKNDAAEEEAERAKRSELMRKERAAEAQKLIAARGSNAKQIFEKGRESQFENKNTTPSPKKIIRDFPNADAPKVADMPKAANPPKTADPPKSKPPPKAAPVEEITSIYAVDQHLTAKDKDEEPNDFYDDVQSGMVTSPPPSATSPAKTPALSLLAQNLPKRQVSDDEEDWNTGDKEEEGQDIYDDAGSGLIVFNQPTSSQVSEASSGLQARALYDYQAAEENELTFDPDDIITNIDMVDDGWWVGDFRGIRGMFPANYVELIN